MSLLLVAGVLLSAAVLLSRAAAIGALAADPVARMTIAQTAEQPVATAATPRSALLHAAILLVASVFLVAGVLLVASFLLNAAVLLSRAAAIDALAANPVASMTIAQTAEQPVAAARTPRSTLLVAAVLHTAILLMASVLLMAGVLLMASVLLGATVFLGGITETYQALEPIERVRIGRHGKAEQGDAQRSRNKRTTLHREGS